MSVGFDASLEVFHALRTEGFRPDAYVKEEAPYLVWGVHGSPYYPARWIAFFKDAEDRWDVTLYENNLQAFHVSEVPTDQIVGLIRHWAWDTLPRVSYLVYTNQTDGEEEEA